MPGNHAISGDLVVRHAKIGATVLDEHPPLFEAAGVEQHVDSFTRGQLALGVLTVDPLLTATSAGGRPLFFQPSQDFLHLGAAALPNPSQESRHPRVHQSRAGRKPRLYWPRATAKGVETPRLFECPAGSIRAGGAPLRLRPTVPPGTARR